VFAALVGFNDTACGRGIGDMARLRDRESD